MSPLSSSSAAILTTNLVGGLGNQLFLLANLIATAKRHPQRSLRMVLPRASFSSSSGPPRPVYWDNLFSNLATQGNVADEELPPLDVHSDGSSRHSWKRVVVVEPRPATPVLLPPPERHDERVVYQLVGFFQSEHFFADTARDDMLQLIPRPYIEQARQHLCHYYLPPPPPTSSVVDGSSFSSDAFHTVAVHVRRGDYLEHRDVFEILEYDYYNKALQTLIGPSLFKQAFFCRGGGAKNDMTTEDVLHPVDDHRRYRVLVFSEDAAYGTLLASCWRTKYPGVSVQHVSPATEAMTSSPPLGGSSALPRDVLELLMMSLCDDVVMANSSFSWWGGFWNSSPGGRVIAPTRWFVKDPYPAMAQMYAKEWILL